MTESIAIAEYLEDVFPPPSYLRLFSIEPRARARARHVGASRPPRPDRRATTAEILNLD